MVIDPAQNKRPRVALALNTSAKFLYERVAKRWIGLRHLSQDLEYLLRLFLRRLQHAVGPRLGEIALLPPPRYAPGYPSQVLDQRQSQHDRDSPEFTQLQRRDCLICGDEAT